MIAIDTNILVYAVDDYEPEKKTIANELVRRLLHQSDEIVIPWQVIVEFLAIQRRWKNLGRIDEIAIGENIADVLTAFEVVVPKISIVTQSLSLTTRFNLSHWDSLLIAACIEANIEILYSEDLSHQTRYHSVTVINPFK